ncbi:hypothetical protein [Candidatus Entotheonella palauensis]|uniref:Uncharacterized protein n=1 Tax=Candidatus Entotheonella gemina TaxID=1429439 RepID=W4LBS6_9BACT|nr:hypothetical protein [Candidatus Entotheonella palauensis]ETW95185.1 MAG: hypothetical protein ETSY2_48525 [Candidatus Entotheonella gemina]
MIKPLARLAAAAVVIGLLLPGGLFAQSIASSQTLASHLAVRCFDVDPNNPNAEGLLVLAPAANRLTLLIDFNEFNNPVGPPPPGEEPIPIANGSFDLTCESFSLGQFQIHTDFSGPLAAYGWDFEANFTNIFPPNGPGLESCFNPRVDNLSFQRDGFFYNCVAGFLLPAMPPN